MRESAIGTLRVSRVGFGCYGMAGAYGSVAETAWRRQVELALDLGINFFDTAADYGEAEVWLGNWLRPRRDRTVIATKCGIGPERRPDNSAAAVLRECEASLRRLGTDRIDLLLVHYDDGVTPVAETVTALEALRRAGKIREYGVSHLPAERIREYLRLGQPAAVMCELHLAATAAVADLLPHAKRRGAAVVAFSPTGRGLLTGRVGPETTFALDDVRSMDPLFGAARREAGIRLAQELAAAGSALGLDAAGAAIAWVLAQEGVAAALTGASRTEHLRGNAAAADVDLPAALVDRLSCLAAKLNAGAARQELAAMDAILGMPLAAGGLAQATRQLLAAMETALAAGLTSEAAVMPLALRLLRPGRDELPLTVEECDEIRRELVALVVAGGPRPG